MNGLIVVMLFFMFFPPYAMGKSLTKGADSKYSSIVINSDMVEIDDGSGVVVFSGNVKATSEDFTIQCNKMTLYYRKRGESQTLSTSGIVVDRIVAVENVRIKRKIGGEAKAEHAEYISNERKIVLTGNPVVRHGKDFIQGERITFFLKENRSLVEGSAENKVKAVFSSPEGSRFRLK